MDVDDNFIVFQIYKNISMLAIIQPLYFNEYIITKKAD